MHISRISQSIEFYPCYASLDLEIDVTDGLVNSAAGVVTGFLPTPDPDDDTYSPKVVLIKFDDERIGRKKRQVSKANLPDDISTPIPTVELPIRIGNNKVKSKRTVNTVPSCACLGSHNI